MVFLRGVDLDHDTEAHVRPRPGAEEAKPEVGAHGLVELPLGGLGHVEGLGASR